MGTIGDGGWVLRPFEEEKQRSPSARPGHARPGPILMHLLQPSGVRCQKTGVSQLEAELTSF